MTADELRKKYGGQTDVNKKADSLREKYQKSPIFSTPEEAQQYAKDNNVKVLDAGIKIPKLTNSTTDVIKQKAPKNKSYTDIIFNKKGNEEATKEMLVEAYNSELIPVKVPENMKDNFRRFENGYQFGDFTKTTVENLGDSAGSILSTTAEIPVRIAKGILSRPEQLATFGASLIAESTDRLGSAASLLGKEETSEKMKDYANRLRKTIVANEGTPFPKLHKGIENLSETLNRNSFTGKLIDTGIEGIGQIGADLAMSEAIGAGGKKLGIKSNLKEIPIKFGEHVLRVPVIAMLAGSGSGAYETYAEADKQLGGIEKATSIDKLQMRLRIARNGIIEGLSEGFFGLLGLGGNDITEKWIEKALSKASSSFDKQLTKIIFAGGAEAFEEFLSYAGNWVADNIEKWIFKNNTVKGKLDFSKQWNWKELFMEMASAFISSGISQGGNAAVRINSLTKNAVDFSERTLGRELTDKEKADIKKNVTNMVLEADKEVEELKKNTPREQIQSALTNQKQNIQSQIQKAQQAPSSQNSTQIPTQKSQNSIQGLEDFTEDDIKDMVTDHVENVTEGNVKIKDITIQDGKVTVTYDSELPADTMNKAINTEPLEIEGVKININMVDINKKKEYNKQYATVAPYLDNNVTEETYSKESQKVEKEFKQKGQEIADSLGIKINKVSSNMGGYKFEDGHSVNEISYTFELEDATEEQSDLFASLLGDLGHESQEAVIASSYVKRGDLNANGIETTIYVNDTTGLIDVLKEVGITDYTIDRTNKAVKFFEIGTESNISNLILDFVEKIGGNYNGREANQVNSRYIGRETRQNIYGTWLQTINKGKQAGNISNYISKAQGKLKESETQAKVKEDTTPYSVNDGFYSQVEKVISTKMSNKADAQTIKNLLTKNGAKQDELDWLDMDSFLASKDSFTKQEVLDYIRANQLELEEVIKDSADQSYNDKEIDRLSDERNRMEEEADNLLEPFLDETNVLSYMLDNKDKFDRYKINTTTFLMDFLGFPEGMYNDETGEDQEFEGRDGYTYSPEEFYDALYEVGNMFDDYYELVSELEMREYARDYGEIEGSTKYSSYASKIQGNPLENNYREVLFTIPNFGGKTYYSPHWEEDNVLAHTRLQDYKDEDNNSVLFVEEIQSDLHQEGRKKRIQR